MTLAGQELEDGDKLTVTAIGTLAADDDFELTAIALDDSTEGLQSGLFRLRVIHAATAVGNVKIWNLTDPDAEPSVLLEDYAYGSENAVVELPFGEYTVGFDVQPADGTPELVFDLPAINENAVINLYAVSNNAGDIYLAAQLPDGSIANINAGTEPAE